uniref:Uncharacterized protein LOC107261395 n=1 Tax=Rhizophora mucronata TaxID=61149 RepID=A0A2P2JVT7_RHIMU
MSKETVVSVEMLCSKCRQKVMHFVAQIEGITSIVLEPSKNTVTVIGEADPVRIIKNVRKVRRSASIVSIGAPKGKKDDSSKWGETSKECVVLYGPQICKRCDAWYVVDDPLYSYCSIL